MTQRIAAYQKFEALRRVGDKRTVVERISSEFGVAKATVYQWYKGRDPLGHRAGRVARVPELLYVLGALLGDGCN